MKGDYVSMKNKFVTKYLCITLAAALILSAPTMAVEEGGAFGLVSDEGGSGDPNEGSGSSLLPQENEPSPEGAGSDDGTGNTVTENTETSDQTGNDGQMFPDAGGQEGQSPTGIPDSQNEADPDLSSDVQETVIPDDTPAAPTPEADPSAAPADDQSQLPPVDDQSQLPPSTVAPEPTLPVTAPEESNIWTDQPGNPEGYSEESGSSTVFTDPVITEGADESTIIPDVTVTDTPDPSGQPGATVTPGAPIQNPEITPVLTVTPTVTPEASPTPSPSPTGIIGLTTSMVSNLHAGKEFYLNSLKQFYGLSFSEDFARIMEDVELDYLKINGLVRPDGTIGLPLPEPEAGVPTPTPVPVNPNQDPLDGRNMPEGLLARNWQDILAVYVYQQSMNGAEEFVLDEKAKNDLARLFAVMNPISIEDGEPKYGNHHVNTYIRENNISKSDRQILKKYLETDCKLLCATVTAARGFVRESVGENVSEERVDVITAAFSLVGKVGYFWGGKSTVLGEDPGWGTVAQVAAEGSSTTGSLRAYGLDCSGFVTWAVINGYEDQNMQAVVGDGTSSQWENAKVVAEKDAQPGDLVFQRGPEAGSQNHVGILVGKTDAGDWIAVHCSSGQNGVTVGEAYSASFRYIREPSFYPEKVIPEETVPEENLDDILVKADLAEEGPDTDVDNVLDAYDDDFLDIILLDGDEIDETEDGYDDLILPAAADDLVVLVDDGSGADTADDAGAAAVDNVAAQDDGKPDTADDASLIPDTLVVDIMADRDPQPEESEDQTVSDEEGQAEESDAAPEEEQTQEPEVTPGEEQTQEPEVTPGEEQTQEPETTPEEQTQESGTTPEEEQVQESDTDEGQAQEPEAGQDDEYDQGTDFADGDGASVSEEAFYGADEQPVRPDDNLVVIIDENQGDEKPGTSAESGLVVIIDDASDSGEDRAETEEAVTGPDGTEEGDLLDLDPPVPDNFDELLGNDENAAALQTGTETADRDENATGPDTPSETIVLNIFDADEEDDLTFLNESFAAGLSVDEDAMESESAPSDARILTDSGNSMETGDAAEEGRKDAASSASEIIVVDIFADDTASPVQTDKALTDENGTTQVITEKTEDQSISIDAAVPVSESDGEALLNDFVENQDEQGSRILITDVMVVDIFSGDVIFSAQPLDLVTDAELASAGMQVTVTPTPVVVQTESWTAPAADAAVLDIFSADENNVVLFTDEADDRPEVLFSGS